MKTIIHVNQHVIKANAKNGTNDPVLTVKTYIGDEYVRFEIQGGFNRFEYAVRAIETKLRSKNDL